MIQYFRQNMSKIPGDNGSSLNRIPVMVPLTAPLFGSLFFKGAYFPQKLTPKSSIETEYKLFQKHVPSYQVKRSEDCFVWAAPQAL
jgi:hypothetical protein